MRRVLAGCLFVITCVHSPQLRAAPGAEPTPVTMACGAACAPASLVMPVEYTRQIARRGNFRADITLHQPCDCVRQLRLILAFTTLGSRTSREHMIKLDVAHGTTTSHVVLTNRELAKLKVAPGQYTVGFALHGERDEPLGESVAGRPFTFGTTQEALRTEPVIPTAIGRAAELAVPFSFDNGGDIPARVTALLVFTRPDTDTGIEYYSPQWVVPPHGNRHVIRLSASKRKALGIGAGPWLVTTAAYDISDQRFAFSPGHLLMIGKTLSQPAPPQVTARVEQGQDLNLTLTFSNSGDSDDLVTAVMLFTGTGRAKLRPIEYKVEGLSVPVGTSTHPIALTDVDRYNLGIRPGRWHIATTALDRAGKRIGLKRGRDFVVSAP